MKWREQAELLMRKAALDLAVVRKLLGDGEIADEIIGFHAQQAAEKMLKAVLSAHRVAYRRTHDLVELIDLLSKNKIGFPQPLERIRELTPFAVELRYDDPLNDALATLDRSWASDSLQGLLKWAKIAIAKIE
jgi:HEPN domain-containing protein